MDVNAYLKRIGYMGSTEPTLETLRALHLAHLYAVPFESLDIHLSRPIVLNYEHLYDKIVNQRRGGFCYELNGMFGWLLTQLGYRVSMLNARVIGSDSQPGIEFDHMTLRVELDEPYLADVGFGEAFREPLRMNERSVQQQTLGSYRLDVQSDLWTYCEPREADEVKPAYIFTLAPHSLEDYAGGCEYQQTSPQSHFTQNRVCSIATPDGRITVTGNADSARLIITSKGVREERPLTSEADFADALRQHFGFNLSFSGGSYATL